MKSKLNKLWFTTLMLFGSAALQADNVGINWLNSNSQGDGSFQSAEGFETATSVQATTATLNAYLYLNYNSSSIMLAGINFIENNHLMTTESISELLVIQNDYNTVNPLLLNALSGRVNADGGLGEQPGFESNVLDTAFALYGLSVADETYDSIRVGLLNYLLNQMGPTGGFKFQTNDSESLYLALMVLRAMNSNLDVINSNRFQYDLLKQHIIALKQPNLGWGSTYETAMALVVLENSQAYYADYWDAILELRSARLPNNSWDNDVFTTAIALIALNKTRNYVEPDGLASISGQVVDSLTQEFIGFAKVNLDGTEIFNVDSLGYFSIDQLSPGEHALLITAPGYIEQSFNFNLAENQNLSLETITLLKKPNTGVLMGRIKAHEDQSPLQNVSINLTGAMTQQVQTNEQGNYAIELTPGDYTVNATLNGRDQVITNFSIQDGQLLNFSPEMYLANTTPWLTSTTLRGRLIDAENFSGIEGALISVDGTATDTSSNQSGVFELIEIDNGSIEMTVIAPGYQDVHISLVSNGGVIDLGDVAVPATNSNSTGRLFGQIKDINSQLPIPSSLIEIQGLALSTFSDQSGNYVIEGIPEFNYTAIVTATGYIPRDIEIAATQHMNTQLNVDLTNSNNQSLIINEFLPEQFVVTQEGPLGLEIEVQNTSSAIDSLMYISAFNDTNTLIDRFSLREELVTGMFQDAPITVPRRSAIQLNSNWSHEQLPTGFYRIELTLFDAEGINLLAQRSVEIEIKSFKSMGAQINLNPQVAAFNNNNPVDIQADILNTGNLAIDEGQITAHVYLSQKFDSLDQYSIVSSDISSPLINSDTGGMVKSQDGYIYVAKGADVLKVDALDNITVFATGFSNARDVEVGTNGEVYVLDSNARTVFELDNTGTEIQEYEFNVPSSYTFKLFGNEFLIGTSNGLYRFDLTTLVVEVVTENQLRYPNALAVDLNDDIYILDGRNNDAGIYKFSGNTTELYFNELGNPTGIVIEDNGDLIVTDRNAGEVIRVDVNQVKQIITDQIPFPEGIAKANNGNYLVTSLNDQVWEVTPAGQISPITNTAIGYPMYLTRDDSGGFYSFNNYSKLIYHFDAAQNATLHNPTTFDAKDLLFDGNLLWVAESQAIHRINPDGSIDSFTAGVNDVTALSADTVDGVILFLTGHAVMQLDPITGLVNDYIQPFLYNEVKALSESNSGTKVISSKGQILTLKDDLTYESFAELTGTVKDMYENSNDIAYVALADKTIHSIDDLNQTVLVATLANIPEQFVVDAAGVIYYTNNSNTIYRYEAGVENALSPVSFNITSELEMDEQNNLWMANNRSAGVIAKYDLTSNLITEFAIPSSLPSFRYPKAIHAVSENEIIIGVKDGMITFDGTEFTDLMTIPEFAGAYLELIDKTSDGNYWINNNRDELMLISSVGQVLKNTMPTTLFETIFPKDLVNHQGVTFIANREGVFKYASSAVIPDLTTDSKMIKLATDPSGQLFMASDTGKPTVYKYNDTTNLLEEIFKYDRSLSGFDITSNGSKVLTSVNSYKNLIGIWGQDGVLQNHYSSVFDPQDILVDQTTDDVFFMANSNNDILKLNANGLAEVLFFTTNANYMHKNGRFLATTSGYDLVRYDLITGDVNRESSPYNNGYFEGIGQLSNGDYVIASSNGLFTYNGQDFNKVGGGLNFIVDINKLSDGTPLILTSSGNSSNIYQLNNNDSFTLLHSGLELEALSSGFDVFNDEIFVTTQTKKSVVKIDSSGSRTVYNKVPSHSGIGQVLAVSPAELYVQDIYANFSQKVYKAKLISSADNQFQNGDLIYSQSATYSALPVNGPKETLDFGSFIPPVAGNYRVDLNSDNQDIGFVTSAALHVGVLAEGNFSSLEAATLPGDYSAATSLTVTGIDTIDSLVIKPETKVELLANFWGGGRFVVDRDGNLVSLIRGDLEKSDPNGVPIETIFDDFDVFYMNTDNEGYVHAKNNSQIVKLEVDGTVLQTTDITAITGVQRHIDVDSQGNYWLSKGGNILNIEAGTGQILDQLTLDNTDYVIYVDENDNLILAGHIDILFFDVNTRKIKVLVDSYGMEGEGFDYDYACGNLIFAPTRLPVLDPSFLSSEEMFVAKVNPDIGITQMLYDSRLSDRVEDIDSIHVDQVNQRLLIFTDRQLKQMEFNCNSLRVELHLELDPSVQITHSSAQPYAINPVAGGNQQWVWYLDGVGADVQNIDFDLLFEDLLDGETRAAFRQAYLLYTNPLDSSQDIRIDLDIPSISAETQKQLNVTLNESTYTADSQVLINNEIINESVLEFDGFVTQIIETETRQYVDHLGNLSITALAAGQSITMDSTWSTANYYAGTYILVSDLIDPAGNLHNRVETPFEIVVNGEGYDVSFNALTTQAQYNQNDSVEINSTLTNLAINSILENMSLELIITAPDSSAVHQQSSPVNDLAANASQQWQDLITLNQAQVGVYTVTFNLLDDAGNVVETFVYNFEVLLDEQLSLGGVVSVDFEQIQPGIDNTCHFEITNESASPITALDIELMVVNLSNQLTVQSVIQQINLAAGGIWQDDLLVPTNSLSSGDHACLIRTTLNDGNGDAVTQATAVFTVTGANQLKGHIYDDFNGDGIKDVNDTGISSVELTLLDNNQNVIQTITSENDGSYQFQPVDNGNYTIVITETGALLNAVMTTDNNNLVLDVEFAIIESDFGYQFSDSRVQGTIWNDENDDGQVDLGENGFENVSVRILDSSLNEFDVTETDAQGLFEFNQITSGPYQIEITDDFMVLDDLRNTTDNNPMSLDVFSHSDLTGNNFGFRQDTFDLDVFTTNCTKSVKENQAITYLVKVRNLGNTDILQAAVENLVPLGLTNVSWTCETTGGATCGGMSGVDDVIDLIDIPQGGEVNYTIDATVSGQLLDIINEQASITMPIGITDDNQGNNQAFDSDMVLDLHFIDGFECSAPGTPATTQKQLLDILQINTKHQPVQLKSYMKKLVGAQIGETALQGELR